jgi:uncharacterized phage protein gp47/JayE
MASGSVTDNGLMLSSSGNIYGMTPEGFVQKRLADILADMNSNISNIYDKGSDSYPFQNASDDGILQQIIGVFAEQLSYCWNAAYQASIQFDPLKNTNSGQSGTVQLNAILRKSGDYTEVMMEVEGEPNTVVPIGTEFSDTSGLQVYASTDTVILNEENPVARVMCKCKTRGSNDPKEGEINQLVTTLVGVNNVLNVETVTVGSDDETDSELRFRQQRSTSLTAYRVVEAIYASIFNVPGVRYCRVYQNSTTYPKDERGIPFKEFCAMVLGGDEMAIAEAIFLRVPLGQIGYGEVTHNFTDRQGITYPISFSRPGEIPVYMKINIFITDSVLFPADAPDLIRASLMDFWAQMASPTDDGTKGFVVGENVIRSRLYSPINKIPGFAVTSLLIGTNPNTLVPQDIIIPWDKVSTLDSSNIQIVLET